MAPSAYIEVNELGILFYALECLGYPVIQRTHFELQGGEIDIELLRKAYLLEIERYPIFKSTINEDPSRVRWHLYWVPLTYVDAHQMIRLCDVSQLSPAEADRQFEQLLFDPFTQYSSLTHPPLSMVLYKYHENRYKLITFFHHAAADSYGCLLFLKDLFQCYTRLVHGTLPPPGEGASAAPGPVMTARLLPDSPAGRIRGFCAGMRVLIRKLTQRQGDSAKLRYGESMRGGSIHAICRAIAPDRMTRYLQASKYLGTTFTGFFAAAQTEALSRWKKRHHEPCERISMQIHQNLRAREEELREVQNKFSVFLVSTHTQDRTSLPRLVQCINEQSRRALENAMAAKLICLLWPLNARIAQKLMSLWGTIVFKNQICADSFQISNIGRIWTGPGGKPLVTHLGDAEITACYMPGHPVPSIGTFTSFCTYGNTLFLSFNYCTWALSRTDAETFVASIEQVLDELAGYASPDAQRSC